MSSKRDVTNSILFNFANDVHSEIGKIRVKPIYAEVFLANLIVAFVLNQNSFSHLYWCTLALAISKWCKLSCFIRKVWMAINANMMRLSGEFNWMNRFRVGINHISNARIVWRGMPSCLCAIELKNPNFVPKKILALFHHMVGHSAKSANWKQCNLHMLPSNIFQRPSDDKCRFSFIRSEQRDANR